MTQPTPYTRLYDFSDFQTVNPSRPLPATELDAELDALKLTTDGLRGNLALIQRNDGALANLSVSPESLSAGALAMIHQGEYNPRGAWAAATAYALGDLINFNGATYLAIIAGTSTASFANDNTAGRWLLIANGALQGGGQAVDLYSGNGAQTAFTLSFNYVGNNAATVFVAGVAQIPGEDFTIVGNALTMVTAPPTPSVAGRKNVMVRGTGIEAQLAADQASTAVVNAQGYAADALASKNAAAASASTATTQASTATTQASTATTQASTATAQALTATTKSAESSASATSAATSAATATNQATAAATARTASELARDSSLAAQAAAAASASNASTSATNAASSATTAGNAQTAAEAARDQTLAVYDSFDDRYLGAKTSDPALDNDGNALLAGSLYFNSVSGIMKLYTGSAWVAAYVQGVASSINFTPAGAVAATNVQTAIEEVDSEKLTKASNLSDLASTATARTNLGLAIGTNVQAYDADTAKTDVVQTFSVAQRGAVVALTDGATITPDFAAGNNYSVTLGGNRTLANPTNIVAGQSGVITVTQDGTGSRTLAFGSYFKFSAGAAPTLTTTAAAVDDLAYYVESATRIVVKALGDAR